ncbi:META domain-containing protein [Hymenobacter sp. H14-R3]|uniref:META domain-containing protein n=1 Tax=Hymenobacter sp. H14-R3 TaxID=3046308 RepID=UPI0024BB92F3|nr:META domain-containing protein [Hymenobacter sp. H14-R3]MDJ0365491.1 META domain-containing protein [Hymenobacter sp. H14-R3]
MNQNFAFYLAAAVLLVGCRHRNTDPAPTPASGLLGTRWALVQVEAIPVAVSSYSYDYNSYIQFGAVGNQLLGLATCDAIQGQFALGTGAQQLTISRLTTTKGSCTSPNVADRYLAALPQTSRYAISHDTLRLYAPQVAKPRLIFVVTP